MEWKMCSTKFRFTLVLEALASPERSEAEVARASAPGDALEVEVAVGGAGVLHVHPGVEPDLGLGACLDPVVLPGRHRDPQAGGRARR
jgi:hypothetical protein